MSHSVAEHSQLLQDAAGRTRQQRERSTFELPERLADSDGCLATRLADVPTDRETQRRPRVRRGREVRQGFVEGVWQDGTLEMRIALTIELQHRLTYDEYAGSL